MTLTDQETRALAERLVEAQRTRTPIPPLTAERPDLSAEDAYRIQQHVVAMRVEAEGGIVGYKVGLTSRAMQELLGVDQPDYGPILASTLLGDGAAIDLAELIAPRVEAEIAFVLERPLEGPGVNVLDVLRATAGLVAAIEVIDSRIEGWKIRLADTIADLASSARVVVAGRIVPVDRVDLRLIGMTLERRGEVVSTGAGAAVLGNPANAVAWAANTLGRLGVTLEEGQIVMPGALHAAVPVEAGDVVRATFDHLGSVGVRFV